jgi:hypothetical protein
MKTSFARFCAAAYPAITAGVFRCIAISAVGAPLHSADNYISNTNLTITHTIHTIATHSLTITSLDIPLISPVISETYDFFYARTLTRKSIFGSWRSIPTDFTSGARACLSGCALVNSGGVYAVGAKSKRGGLSRANPRADPGEGICARGGYCVVAAGEAGVGDEHGAEAGRAGIHQLREVSWADPDGEGEGRSRRGAEAARDVVAIFFTPGIGSEDAAGGHRRHRASSERGYRRLPGGPGAIFRGSSRSVKGFCEDAPAEVSGRSSGIKARIEKHVAAPLLVRFPFSLISHRLAVPLRVELGI